MIGMNASTGKKISGLEHLHQSIARLIFTPPESYPMKRAYGCYATELLAAPANQENVLKIYSSVTQSIIKYEPRFIPTRIKLKADASTQGRFNLHLEGMPTQAVGELQQGQAITLEFVLKGGQ